MDKVYKTLWPDHSPVPDPSFKLTLAVVLWFALLIHNYCMYVFAEMILCCVTKVSCPHAHNALGLN